MGLAPETPGTVAVAQPFTPVDLDINVSILANGGSQVCAALNTQDVLCWGQPARLGDGSDTPRGTQDVMAPVVGLQGMVRQLAAGQDHTCARVDEGRLFCWGLSPAAFGLTEGVATSQAVPVESLGQNVLVVATHGSRTCTIAPDEPRDAAGTEGQTDGEDGEDTEDDGTTDAGVVDAGVVDAGAVMDAAPPLGPRAVRCSSIPGARD